MPAMTNRRSGPSLLIEMEEFALFSKGTQRYIRRSLDVALRRCDPIARWSRCPQEARRIRAQRQIYGLVGEITALIPDGDDIAAASRLMGPLVALTAFDLAEGRLTSFASYRFLYERLIGAAVRPWLPAAFCAAAALPHLHPEHRRELLGSFSLTAMTPPGWSGREPAFLPEWVDKVEDSIEA